MLKKYQRISKTDLAPNEFPFHFLKVPFFSLKIRKNTLGVNRYAFIVSKKVDKRAVVRNMLKRKMNTAVEQLPGTKGCDLVFFLRKETGSLSSQELQRVLQQIIEKQVSL